MPYVEVMVLILVDDDSNIVDDFMDDYEENIWTNQHNGDDSIPFCQSRCCHFVRIAVWGRVIGQETRRFCSMVRIHVDDDSNFVGDFMDDNDNERETQRSSQIN